MFTGIVEAIGVVKSLSTEDTNLHITLESPFAKELKIDQSVSHNGVCLTVVDIKDGRYAVTAIEETLEKSNLGLLDVGDSVNLERAMKMGTRLDGHLVQGHVDQTGICVKIEDLNGSWEFTFEYNASQGNITIPKGSITVDGTSLTVVRSDKNIFSVAIIPYTYSNTIFKHYREGSVVNLEFDVIGKYVARLMELRQ